MSNCSVDPGSTAINNTNTNNNNSGNNNSDNNNSDEKNNDNVGNIDARKKTSQALLDFSPHEQKVYIYAYMYIFKNLYPLFIHHQQPSKKKKSNKFHIHITQPSINNKI